MDLNRRGFVGGIIASVLAFFGRKEEASELVETTTMSDGKYWTKVSRRTVEANRFFDGCQVRETKEFKALCQALGRTPSESLRVEIDQVYVDGDPLEMSGYGLYHTPEFLNLCERLGIRWELHTKWLVIHFKDGEFPTVTHNYALYKVRDDAWPIFKMYAKKACIPLETENQRDDARPLWEAFQVGRTSKE